MRSRGTKGELAACSNLTSIKTVAKLNVARASDGVLGGHGYAHGLVPVPEQPQYPRTLHGHVCLARPRFEVSCVGALLCAQAVLPPMLASEGTTPAGKEHQRVAAGGRHLQIPVIGSRKLQRNGYPPTVCPSKLFFVGAAMAAS